MNNIDFYKYLHAGALDVAVFPHLWQFALAIGTCPAELVEAMSAANPKHAQAYAEQEHMYALLDAPNELAAALSTAGSDAQRLALMEAADPAVLAEYADDLALEQYSAAELCDQYRTLILGEVS